MTVRPFPFSRTFHFTAFIVYGFVSLGSQLILLRELSVLFFANELFIGFSLGAWLLWTGCGSYLGQKIGPGKFPLLMMALGPMILSEIALIRFAKSFFGFGMIIGPVPMAGTTLILLSPIGILIGAIFSSGSGFSKARFGTEPSRIYFLETIGAILCGILYTAYLAGQVSNVVVAVISSFTILIASLAFLWPVQRKNVLGLAHAVLLGLAPAALITIVFSLPFWNDFTLKSEWKGYELLASRDSRFSNLVVTKTNALKQLFQDGLITGSFPDPESHEEIAHLPLLAHPDPKEVLLLGGGAMGEIAEILKHPVRSVNYVEIDPDVLGILKPYLDSKNKEVLENSRVTIHHKDGRVFLKQTQNSYDVIILNLPAPHNAQINRFYTEEFFQEAKTHLRPGGILALKIASSENYLPAQVSFFGRSIYRTLNAAFPQVSFFPGSTLIVLACDEKTEIRPQTLINRYQTRNLDNVLVVPSYFQIKMDPGRIQFFQERLTLGIEAPINHDFKPVSYFYLRQTWLLKFQSTANFIWSIAFLTALTLFLRILIRKRRSLFGNLETITIFSLGFSAISYEIVLLLAFQAVVGYIYWQLGLCFASFMAGLAFGSWIGLRNRKKNSDFQKKKIWLLLAAQAIYGGLLALFIAGGANKIPQALLPICFNFAIIPTGFILGYGFASLAESETAGKLYASDLWGSALGAFLAGLFLIPFFGFAKLLIVIAAMLFVSAVIIRFKSR
jgi:spermidine synthase